MGKNPNAKPNPTTDFGEELLKRTQILIDKTKKNVMQSYIKYKDYYDKKARATPLKVKDFCYILQPKADHQGSKIPFRDFRWIGPYVVEKVLPNENYIVRRVNTNKTQILHRIRLKRFIPNSPIEDICPEGNFQKDDNIVIPQDDLYTIAWESDFGDLPFDRPNEHNLDADGPNDMITVPLDDNNARNLHSDEPQGAPTQNSENGPIGPTDLSSENIQNSPEYDTPDVFEPEPMDISPSSSRGGDTTVPGVSNCPEQNTENNDCDVTEENVSPRGKRYNLRPNPNPNFSEDFRY